MAGEQAAEQRAQEVDNTLSTAAPTDVVATSQRLLQSIQQDLAGRSDTYQQGYLNTLQTRLSEKSPELLPMLALARLNQDARENGGSTADIRRLEGSGVGINANRNLLDQRLLTALRERPDLLSTLRRGRGDNLISSGNINPQIEAFRQRRSQIVDTTARGDMRNVAAEVLLRQRPDGRTLFDQLAHNGGDRLYRSDLDKAINDTTNRYGLSPREVESLRQMRQNWDNSTNGFFAGSRYSGWLFGRGGEGYIQKEGIARALGHTMSGDSNTGDVAALQRRLGQVGVAERPVERTLSRGVTEQRYGDRVVTTNTNTNERTTIYNNRPEERQVEFLPGHPSRAGQRDVIRSLPGGITETTTHGDPALNGKTRTVAKDSSNNRLYTTVTETNGNSETQYPDGTRVQRRGDVVRVHRGQTTTAFRLGEDLGNGQRAIESMNVVTPGQPTRMFEGVRVPNSNPPQYNLVERSGGRTTTLENAVMTANGAYQFTQNGVRYEQRPNQADAREVSDNWSTTGNRGDRVLNYPGNGNLRVTWDQGNQTGEPRTIVSTRDNQTDRFTRDAQGWLRNGQRVTDFNFNAQTGEIKYTQNRNETTIDAAGRRLLTKFTYPNGGEVSARYRDGQMVELTRPHASAGTETLTLGTNGMWTTNRGDQIYRNVQLDQTATATRGTIRTTDNAGLSMETTVGDRPTNRIKSVELPGGGLATYSYANQHDTTPNKIERRDNAAGNVVETLNRSGNNWTRTRAGQRAERIGTPTIDSNGAVSFVNRDNQPESWGVATGRPLPRTDGEVSVRREGDTLTVRHATGHFTTVTYDQTSGAQHGRPREISHLGEPRQTFTRVGDRNSTTFTRNVNGAETTVNNVQVNERTGSITFEENGAKMELHPSGRTVVRELSYPNNAGKIEVTYNARGMAQTVVRTDANGRRQTYSGNNFRMDTATGSFEIGTSPNITSFNSDGTITRNGQTTRVNGDTVTPTSGRFEQPDGRRVNYTYANGNLSEINVNLPGGGNERITRLADGTYRRTDKDGRRSVVTDVNVTPDSMSYVHNGRKYEFHRDGRNIESNAQTGEILSASRVRQRGATQVREPITDLSTVSANVTGSGSLDGSQYGDRGRWGVAHNLMGSPRSGVDLQIANELSNILREVNSSVTNWTGLAGGTHLINDSNRGEVKQRLMALQGRFPNSRRLQELIDRI